MEVVSCLQEARALRGRHDVRRRRRRGRGCRWQRGAVRRRRRARRGRRRGSRARWRRPGWGRGCRGRWLGRRAVRGHVEVNERRRIGRPQARGRAGCTRGCIRRVAEVAHGERCASCQGLALRHGAHCPAHPQGVRTLATPAVRKRQGVRHAVALVDGAHVPSALRALPSPIMPRTAVGSGDESVECWSVSTACALPIQWRPVKGARAGGNTSCASTPVAVRPARGREARSRRTWSMCGRPRLRSARERVNEALEDGQRLAEVCCAQGPHIRHIPGTHARGQPHHATVAQVAEVCSENARAARCGAGHSTSLARREGEPVIQRAKDGRCTRVTEHGNRRARQLRVRARRLGRGLLAEHVVPVWAHVCADELRGGDRPLACLECIRASSWIHAR
mmetsp:Transcript_14316/g.43510  ORF Transcript_14316/g.43510 Transcript_14316/m.43510 type:complete len:393 (-) Transcript_14316:197-1375(-)